jgi:hypothetical protein
MSDYNWCHGPNCHTYQTQSRIRGSGDNKVLRTRRIKTYNGNRGFYNYFCGQICERDFCNLHAEAIVALAPRREALETPIKVEKEKYETTKHRYTDNGYEPYDTIATRTTIKSVDNSNG